MPATKEEKQELFYKALFQKLFLYGNRPDTRRHFKEVFLDPILDHVLSKILPYIILTCVLFILLLIVMILTLGIMIFHVKKVTLTTAVG